MARLMNLHPNATEIGMSEKNKNGENQLFIVVEGEKYVLSKGLTELVRTKKVSVNQLGDYEVRLMTEDAQGKPYDKPFNSLGLPSEDIKVKINGWKAGTVGKTKELTVEALADLW
jgi:hypothetical protein